MNLNRCCKLSLNNQTEAEIVMTSSNNKVNGAESTSVKGVEYIVISANDKLDRTAPASDKETESIAQETAYAIARSKSSILLF